MSTPATGHRRVVRGILPQHGGREVKTTPAGLTSVTIPASVVKIGQLAFSCPRLTAITVDSGNAAYSSVDGVLFDKLQTALVQYPASCTQGSSFLATLYAR